MADDRVPPGPDPQVSLDEIVSELRQLRGEVAELREENARLKVENQGLRDRVRHLEDGLISARRATKRLAGGT